MSSRCHTAVPTFYPEKRNIRSNQEKGNSLFKSERIEYKELVTQMPEKLRREKEGEATQQLAAARSDTPRLENQKEEVGLPQLRAWGHLIEPETTEALSYGH